MACLMKRVADLSAKLDMLLKASSLSRVALAQQVGVDKSLVGRWVKGSIHPGEHNLAKLTAVFQETFPMLTLADWYEEQAVLADRIGIAFRAGVPSGPEMRANGPFAKIVEASESDIAFRAETYTGFWRTTRPSVLMPTELFHDYGIFRLTDDGMIEVSMEGSGLKFEGWMFPMAGNLYVFLFDPVGRTPLIVLMKGVTLPRAMSMDGILLLSALDPARTPAALPIVLERIGDLSGDREADDARLLEIIETKPEPLQPLSEEDLKSIAYQNIGPEAAKHGGRLFMSSIGAFSRGTTSDGLKG